MGFIEGLVYIVIAYVVAKLLTRIVDDVYYELFIKPQYEKEKLAAKDAEQVKKSKKK